MIYSTRRFVLCLALCYFVLEFFSSFNIAITSLRDERASLGAFRTFVRFALVWFVCFLFLLVSGKGWFFFCECGTPWTFLLPPFLFYEALCFKFRLVLFCSCVFSVRLALRLPRLCKSELFLVFFVRLFDLRLFGFVCFFFLVSGKGCSW